MCTMIISKKRKDLLDAVHHPSFVQRGTKAASVYVSTETMVDISYLVTTDLVPALEDRATDGPLCIVHAQSPTGRSYSAHPAHADDGAATSLLWHNGQLVDWDTNLDAWDTRYMLRRIESAFHDTGLQGVADMLSTLRGSFACIWIYEDNIYVFRNAMAPLHASGTSVGTLAIDSETHIPIAPNTIFEAIFDEEGALRLHAVARFNNTYNPYGL